MITKEEYEKACKVIEAYKAQQLKTIIVSEDKPILQVLKEYHAPLRIIISIKCILYSNNDENIEDKLQISIKYFAENYTYKDFLSHRNFGKKSMWHFLQIMELNGCKFDIGPQQF